jgi:HD-GYP domain-containing protein (c-di-GMP phosphodiesterase class II)
MNAPGVQAESMATLLLATSSRARLYGREHELTKRAAEQLVALLDSNGSKGAGFRMVIRGEQVELNDLPVEGSFGSASCLARKLSSRGIARLDLLPGLDAAELLEFCTELESRRAALSARPHVRIAEGRIIAPEIRAELESLRVRAPEVAAGGAFTDDAARIAELVDQVRDHQEVRLRSFEEIALGFLSRFARQGRLLPGLAEVRNHDRFTYLHAANVATIVIGFALDLGLDRRLVYELGISALLHDLGKQAIPPALLAKKGKPTDEEWAVIRRHPVEGARLLARQKGVPRLAIVVAFEHHLHFEPGGGYPHLDPPRRPLAESQIVSIADMFDALFGNRSYHQKFDLLDALGILHEERGRGYDPALVDLFTRYITKEVEGEG